MVALGIGLHLAWTSRRKGGTRRRRLLRRTGIGGAAVLTGYYVVMPLSAAYAFTHLSYATVPEPHLGVTPEDVSFETSDGLTLRGWFVPSRNGAVVIASPGRTSPRDEARMLVAHGHGVLLFDRRGEGESDGDPHMLGWSGRADINAAVSYLHERGVDPDRIGGIGLSVGGEMLLEAAGESDGLRAVVSEGGSRRSMADDFTQPGFAKWVDVPGFVVRDAAPLSSPIGDRRRSSLERLRKSRPDRSSSSPAKRANRSKWISTDDISRVSTGPSNSGLFPGPPTSAGMRSSPLSTRRDRSVLRRGIVSEHAKRRAVTGR